MWARTWKFKPISFIVKNSKIGSSYSKLTRYQYCKFRNSFLRLSSSTSLSHAENSENQISDRIKEIVKVLLPWSPKEHELREILMNQQNLLIYSLKSWKDTIKFLIDYGFPLQLAIKAISGYPDMLKLSSDKLLNQLQLLKIVGLNHESLPSVVSRFPLLLLLTSEDINERIERLKSIITRDDIVKLVVKAPGILVEDWNDIHKKVQYVRFHMGLEQAEMIKANIFIYPLDYIRLRHHFLTRAGKFVKPDNRGRTPFKNPSLKHILEFDDTVFLNKLARLSQEEYEIFDRILQREISDGLHDDEDDLLDNLDSDDEVNYLDGSSFQGSNYSEG